MGDSERFPLGNSDRFSAQTQETASPFRQVVYDFDLDGKVYFLPQEVVLKSSEKKGYLIASASKIEACLGNEPTEESLSKEALLEKAIRVQFGLTAHAFYTLSAVATLVAGHNQNPHWQESHLSGLLRTWKPKEIEKATKIMQQQGRFINQYDYQNLWHLLEERMLGQPPFSANMPLNWTYPSSGDVLPSPQEIGAEWQSQGLPEFGEKFATACLNLERESTTNEFSPWNMRAIFFELSAILMINTQEPPIKMIVPIRLDQLRYQPRENSFQPIVSDLKTRLPLDFQTNPVKRPSLAVLLYRLAAEKMKRSLWPAGESPFIFLQDNDFSLAVNNEREINQLEEDLSPRIFFRSFDGQTAKIVDKEVKPPEDWREQLLPLLYQAQENLKRKLEKTE